MRKIIYFALGAALMLTTSCSNEETSPLTEKREKVNFVLGGVSTRTVTEDDFTTKFVAGDQIGIYATGQADGHNELFEVLADGTLTSESNIYYTSTSGKANFYAYYPWTQQNEEGVVRITVPEHQDNEEGFNRADFMTAVQKDVEANTDNIELKFRHQMALVQVEITKDKDVPLPDDLLLTAQRTLAWNYAEGSYGYEGEDEEIWMWKKQSGDASTIFWGMIPPQNIEPRTKLFTIRCGNNSYVFTTVNEVSFLANTIKKFSIKIASDGSLVVFSNDIVCGEWDQDESVIEGEGTLVVPNTLMETTDFEHFSWQEITKNKEQINAAGWWRFQSNENDAIEIIEEGAPFTDRGHVMHLYRETVPGWHNGTFYYCVQNVQRIAGNYVLRFKARSSETADMKANQLRIGAFTQTATVDEETGKTTYTDYFPVIINSKGEEVSTVFTQVLTSDSYQEYSVSFNLSKVSTINSGTASKLTDDTKTGITDEMLQKVVLYISCNAKQVDFWIDDISWMPENE